MMIHHLNLGSMREIAPTPDADALPPARVVCHALLVETDAGLVLVESGLGLGDAQRPHDHLDAEWTEQVQPLLRPAETAVRQVTRLGYDPADVRHIVLTHLDVDHSGGLPDFPHANVHVLEREHHAAMAQAPSRRYRPAHWAHRPHWVTYTADGGEAWFGFTGTRQLEGLPPGILLVPLGGHSAGHAGVAVRNGDRWLLHAGDAYFYHRELDPEAAHGHPLLDVVQNGAQIDQDLRLSTRERLRDLVSVHSDEVEVVCAHDPWELERDLAE